MEELLLLGPKLHPLKLNMFKETTLACDTIVENRRNASSSFSSPLTCGLHGLVVALC